jgi:hypothetical protein
VEGWHPPLSVAHIGEADVVMACEQMRELFCVTALRRVEHRQRDSSSIRSTCSHPLEVGTGSYYFLSHRE